jgi:NAD(P)-dependent dehydrogenase (short-subunit alcohol dehydrogenase family)
MATKVLQDRVALVTGSSRGIGAAIATTFATEGARVVVHGRDEVALAAVRLQIAELGGEATSVTGDITVAADIDRMREQVLDRYGRVDVLVANAYAITRGRAHELPEEGWDRTVDVCLKSTYLALRALGEPLLAAEGSLVLVSSVHATMGVPGFSAYAAAKGGLVAYARQLAVEYGPRLRVNAVLPGPIRTRQWDRISDQDVQVAVAGTAAGRLGTAAEVAAAIAFLAADEASYITGVALPVDGGWTVAKATP